MRPDRGVLEQEPAGAGPQRAINVIVEFEGGQHGEMIERNPQPLACDGVLRDELAAIDQYAVDAGLNIRAASSTA
jgi:hypothetical protein